MCPVSGSTSTSATWQPLGRYAPRCWPFQRVEQDRVLTAGDALALAGGEREDVHAAVRADHAERPFSNSISTTAGFQHVGSGLLALLDHARRGDEDRLPLE
jgi:hypothetical protein